MNLQAAVIKDLCYRNWVESCHCMGHKNKSFWQKMHRCQFLPSERKLKAAIVCTPQTVASPWLPTPRSKRLLSFPSLSTPEDHFFSSGNHFLKRYSLGCSSLQRAVVAALPARKRQECADRARSLKGNCFLSPPLCKHIKQGFIKTPLCRSPTSFWPREAVMQVKDYFLHKVLNVTVLRSSYKHHPVVGKTFHGGFLPHLGSVPKLQFHLNSTL